MEQNLPVITKKVWSLVRVIFCLLKKGIAKRKLFVDLNLMMKQGKIAGKVLNNLLFHHRHNNHHLSFPTPSDEYEFSCRNTPPYPLSLFSTHNKHKTNRVPSRNPPLAVDDNCDDIIIDPTVIKVLDMMKSTAVSPPVDERMTRQSPLPVMTQGGDESPVDEAAENFIRRFYNDRRRED